MVNVEEESTVISLKKRRKSSSSHVTFKEGEEIINPGKYDIRFAAANLEGKSLVAVELPTCIATCLQLEIFPE